MLFIFIKGSRVCEHVTVGVISNAQGWLTVENRASEEEDVCRHTLVPLSLRRGETEPGY